MNNVLKYIVCTVFCALFFMSGSAYGDGKFTLHYIHFETGQLLVAIPPGNTVSPTEHFALSGRSGNFIVYIFPFEILETTFWSQPMKREVLERAVTGSLAFRVVLDEHTRNILRMEGKRVARSLDVERRKRRMSSLIQELDEGAESREVLRGKLTSLRKRELELEEELLRVERHNERRIHALGRNIETRKWDLAEQKDERRELQERRRVISRDPEREGEAEAITKRIRNISKYINNIRRNLARLRERRRRLGFEADEAFRRLEGVTLDIRSVEIELMDMEVRMERLGREIEGLAGEERS